VYVDDCTQFVLKIKEYLLLLFVNFLLFCSVVDLECLSRIWFFSSRIWIFPSRIRVFPSQIWIFLFKIWDVYSGSGFFHPRSRIWIFPSRIPDLDFSILDSGSGIFHPLSRIWIFQSRIHIRNTALTKILSTVFKPKKLLLSSRIYDPRCFLVFFFFFNDNIL
jgi:hypothetical protein